MEFLKPEGCCGLSVGRVTGIQPVTTVISFSSLQVWASWCWLSAFQRTFGKICQFPVVPSPGRKPRHHTLSFLSPP